MTHFVHRLRLVFALSTVLAGLSGCGWRLQGSETLPRDMSVVRIETVDVYSDFYRELRGRLQAAGAQVQTSGNGADTAAVMRVHADQTGQRVVSVSVLNQPEQYEVYYRVEYSVSLHGVEVVPRQELQLTSNYSYDTRTVLAKQHEHDVLQQSLARELAAMVLRRLRVVERDSDGTRS